MWDVNQIERSYIQQLQLQGSSINEQNPGETNYLFALLQDPDTKT